ncbi:MAG: tetratricopeptide repeat protein [Clostridia bacterium]|nr:tetratricopeptide repeat protein [Clostridia bacterium]
MLERLKEAIQKERFSWALNGLIEDIRKIKSGPEADSVVMLAYEKRAKLLEAEEKERVKRERWEKRKKWIKGSAAAVILLGIVTCCLLSYHVFQPEKLEKARALAREEQYAEAAAAYRSLAINGLFSNPAVAARAGDELKALLNQWALVLVEQGDRKAAIEKYEEAGNTDAVLDNRKAYAEEAEEKGLLQEAISQYEQLPDTGEKISELYARLVVQYLEQENYELALNSFDRSDRELMQLYQITKGEIYRLWGKALAEQGRTDDAIQKLKKATDSDETLDLLQALYVRQADEKGRQLLEQWEKDGRKKDARQLRQFADTGAKLNTVNAQLHYWKLLADADIDITQVYPAGVEVNDFLLPAYTSVFEEHDASKPLFFIREEKEYTISMTDVSGSSGGKAVHDPQDPAYFTVTLLPELWQRLPKERRAASLRECTCIFVLDQTYQSAGTYYGKYRVKNYVAEMYTKQTGRKAPVSSKTLESKGVFPLYTARMALLVWNYPGNEAKVLAAKTNEAHYKPNFLTGGSVVVDWSNESSYSVSTIKLGLSGKFDQDWVTETVQSCYNTVLGMGGE